MLRSCLLVGLLTTAGCAMSGSATRTAASPLEGRPLPAGRVPLLAGGELDLASLRGRVVLLDFWATGCDPFRESPPFYQGLHGELGPRGLTVRAISVDETRDAPSGYLADKGFGFTVGWGPEGRWPERLGVKTMPTAYVVDRAGVVRRVHESFRRADRPEIRGLIESLL